MEIWQAIILGLTQGLAEFLPVSSSGHLLLVREMIGVAEGDFLLFDVMMHVGTLLAILVAFFKDILALFKPPFKTIGLILLASIPAGLVGLLAGDAIESIFATAKYLCFFFLATAVLLLLTEFLAKRTAKQAALLNPPDLPDTASPDTESPKSPPVNPDGTQPLGIKAAVYMGLMQSVGVFRGISRSGSTIFGGVAAKANRTEVAKFSFFMSVPIILGSAVLEIFTADFATVEWLNVFVGMATSFVSGIFAIKLMMRVIAKANYKWFALYLFVISVLSFVFLFLGV